MPENQSQPRTSGYQNPQGGPTLGQEAPAERGDLNRPSDTEAARAPEEGRAVRGSEDRGGPQDQLATSGFRQGGLGRDEVVERANQVNRDVTLGNSGLDSGLDPYAAQGTDVHTAGAHAADALPKEAVMTPASELVRDQGGTKDRQ